MWGVGCGVWGLPPYLRKKCMMAGTVVTVAAATCVWGLGFKVRVLGVGFWVQG